MQSLVDPGGDGPDLGSKTFNPGEEWLGWRNHGEPGSGIELIDMEITVGEVACSYVVGVFYTDGEYTERCPPTKPTYSSPDEVTSNALANSNLTWNSWRGKPLFIRPIEFEIILNSRCCH